MSDNTGGDKIGGSGSGLTGRHGKQKQPFVLALEMATLKSIFCSFRLVGGFVRPNGHDDSSVDRCVLSDATIAGDSTFRGRKRLLADAPRGAA